MQRGKREKRALDVPVPLLVVSAAVTSGLGAIFALLPDFQRELPFETWVEVTNLNNGRKVAVRITDRGPFVRKRIVDLSLAAARDIDMVRAGTARVRLKVIRPPTVTTTSR